MSTPTVADATTLLTDPGMRVESQGERIPGYVQMRATEIVSLLAGPDDDRVNARTLVVEALAQIGGLDRSHWSERTSRGGARERHPQDFVEDYWTPEHAFPGG